MNFQFDTSTIPIIQWVVNMGYEQILKLALVLAVGLGAYYLFRRINKTEPTYNNCTFIYKDKDE